MFRIAPPFRFSSSLKALGSFFALFLAFSFASAQPSDTLYHAPFNLPDGAVQCPQSPPKWARNASGANLAPPFAHFEVQQNGFEAQNINGEASLITDTIDPDTGTAVAFFVISGKDLHSSDSIKLSYKEGSNSWKTFEARGGSFSKDTIATPIIEDRTLLRSTVEQGMAGGGKNRERKHRVEQIRAIQLSSKFDVTIEASPEGSICPGECVWLTASSEFDYDNYLWSPPSSIKKTNGNKAKVCPNSTTTYQVSASGTISFLGTTLKVTDEDKYTVEVGDAPDFNISNVQYPNGGNKICLDPETDNCAEFTITAPSGLTNISFDPKQGIEKTDISSNPFSSTWKVEACPNQTVTYTITATHPFFDCPRTKTVEINVGNCKCEDFTPNKSFTSTSVFISNHSYFNTSVSHDDLKIGANTTLVIDHDLLITGSNLKMGKDAKILVKSGNTLTIDAAGQSGRRSHLFSCTEMWDGIFVQGGGKLIVREKSVVEDAKKAVEMLPSGEIELINARFNKNRTHVEISGTGTQYPNIKVWGSHFTTRALYSPGVTLLPPHTGEVGREGFLLEPNNLNKVVIGNPNKKENVFDRLQYGIRGIKATFEVVNSKFMRIHPYKPACSNGSECPPICPCPALSPGVAILGYQYFTIYPSPNIDPAKARIGVSTTYSNQNAGNTFQDCNTAVELRDYQLARIEQNHMDGFGLGLGFTKDVGDGDDDVNTPQVEIPYFINSGPEAAVEVYQSDMNSSPFLPSDYDIENDTILDYPRAILVDYVNEPHKGDLDIKRNIARPRKPEANSGEYSPISPDGKGIEIRASNPASPSSLSPLDWDIMKNKVVDFRRLVKISGPKFHHKKVIANTLKVPTSTLSPDDKVLLNIGAVLLKNTRNQNVSHNDISGTASPAHPDDPIIHKGIISAHGWDQNITCNRADSIGEAYFYYSQNIPTSFFTNEMEDFNQGVLISNGGVLGQQGNSSTPSGNKWLNAPIDAPSNNQDGYDTYSQISSDGGLSPFYVNQGGATEPTLNNYNISNSVAEIDIFPINQPPGPICPTIPTPIQPPSGQKKAQLKRVAIDTTSYTYAPEGSRWWAMYEAYKSIKADSTLPGGDSLLIAFEDSLDNANIGACREIDREAQAGNTTQASSTNSSMNCGNSLDSTLKAFNKIYLNSWAIDSSLTNQQAQDLWAIAQKCPITHGPGVYRARNMVRTLSDSTIRFQNDCPEPNGQEMRTPANGDQVRAQWAPNPASERSVLSYDLGKGKGTLILRNSTGSVIDRYPLEDKGIQAVKLSSLRNGLYFYEIRKEGRRVKAGKLMVTR